MRGSNIHKKGKRTPKEIRECKDKLYNLFWSYIIPDENKVEYIVPTERRELVYLFDKYNPSFITVDDNGKFNDKGNKSDVRYFYIDKQQHDELISLCEEFEIPEHLHTYTIYAFLNMVFAWCRSESNNQHSSNNKAATKELENLSHLLKSFSNEEKILSRVKLEYFDKHNKKKEFSEFSGHIANNLFSFILRDYDKEKIDKLIDISNKPLVLEKDFKNSEKAEQSYFAIRLFHFLDKEIRSNIYILNKPFEDEKEALKALHKKYSERKMFLFIAKLMNISELVTFNEDAIDTDLIQYIKDKIK